MNLMLDEDTNGKAIRQALDALPFVNITNTFDCGFRAGTADETLVAFTREKNKILVSKNISDMNEVKFPPCGHGGIIAFNRSDLTVDYMIPRIMAIKSLSLTAKIKSHVTKIYDERIEVHTLEGKIEKKFKDHARTKHIY